MYNKIPLNRDTIDDADIARLIEWLKTSPRLTKGEVTKQFEAEWAKRVGTKYSVFVNSGSSANLLMLSVLKEMKLLKNYDCVVVPGLAWATDLAPVMQLGLSPILCDIDLNTLSVDINKLEEVFERHEPKALLLVSILGLSPNMEEIVKLCEKYDVILLEDNCESVGTTFGGKQLGTFGLMSSFSTYFGHHFSTIEGGFVNTNDEEIYNMLLMIRSHGWDRDLSAEKQEQLRAENQVSDFNSLYTFYVPGFNIRSTDLNAYIGLGQLEKLDSIIQKRNSNFLRMQEGIKNNFWKPVPFENSFTSNFCYPIITEKRDALVKRLQESGIECRPLVCGSMGTQPFYVKKYGVDTKLKNCQIVDKFGLYIPNNPSLTEEEISRMIRIVNEEL